MNRLFLATLTITFSLLCQHGQAKVTPESVIKLQVKSIDSVNADRGHKGRLIDNAESDWMLKTEQKLQALMQRKRRIAARLQNAQLRHDLVHTIYYEAKRAGLDPDLILAVIQVESEFRKYAISSAGARGYLQVMPFWANIVAEPAQDLFNVKTNLRIGCAIFRSYLDKEGGNIPRALARYNGSIGRSTYPNQIYSAWN